MLKIWLKKLLWSGLPVFFLGTVFLFYSFWIEPNQLVLDVQTVSINHWNKSLNGFKVVAITDIHGGSNFIDETKIKQIVEFSNAQNPDIIVLLGDFVSQSHGKNKKDLMMPIETIAQNLQGFKSKYGVFGVIGNHDWWYDENKVREELEKIGVKMLENETSTFDVNGQKVTILGIEDFWKRRKVEIGGILTNIQTPENIIAITHNPDSFDQIPDTLAITIAGHTHGGQVKFPFIGAPIVPAKKEYTAGHIAKDGKNMFVTTGIGTSGIPIRFMVPPEIAVIILNSKN